MSIRQVAIFLLLLGRYQRSARYIYGLLLPRIPLPRTRVNKGKKKGRSCYAPALAPQLALSYQPTGSPRSTSLLRRLPWCRCLHPHLGCRCR